jgi:hypothetical protein
LLRTYAEAALARCGNDVAAAVEFCFENDMEAVIEEFEQVRTFKSAPLTEMQMHACAYSFETSGRVSDRLPTHA